MQVRLLPGAFFDKGPVVHLAEHCSRTAKVGGSSPPRSIKYFMNMIKKILNILIQFIIWYFFIYLWLYTIKNPVNLWLNSFLILIIASIGFFILFSKK